MVRGTTQIPGAENIRALDAVNGGKPSVPKRGSPVQRRRSRVNFTQAAAARLQRLRASLETAGICYSPGQSVISGKYYNTFHF